MGGGAGGGSKGMFVQRAYLHFTGWEAGEGVGKERWTQNSGQLPGAIGISRLPKPSGIFRRETMISISD